MVRAMMTAVVATVAIPLSVLAQAPTPAEHQHGQGSSQAQGQTPAAGRSQEMMQQMHQQMMAKVAAMDQRLQTLVSQMNAAQGQAKVDATAAVVNEMFDQRREMEQLMSGMMERMHQHGMAGMMGQPGMMGGQGDQEMGTSGRMMPGAMATFDPVCREKIEGNGAPTATYQGKTYQFCSEADRDAFLKNPSRYLGGR